MSKPTPTAQDTSSTTFPSGGTFLYFLRPHINRAAIKQFIVLVSRLLHLSASTDYISLNRMLVNKKEW